MALSTNLREATPAVVATPGTSVAPATAVPDNCHTVIILNQSSSGTVYVGNGAAGGALSLAGGATPIPAGGQLTLNIGVLSQRGGQANFIYDATVATTVAITYVNASHN